MFIPRELRFAFFVLLVLLGSSALAFVVIARKKSTNPRPPISNWRDAASHLSGEARASAKSNFTYQDTSERGPQEPKIENELITITHLGIEPTSITRPPGQFFVTVQDRSGLSGTHLQLRNDSNQTLFSVNSTRERRDWSKLLDLAPGRYTLIERNHSEWGCVITINSR